MTLEAREMDEVSRALDDAMLKIVEELEGREQNVRSDAQLSELLELLHKHETDMKSQKFAQWAVSVKTKVRRWSTADTFFADNICYAPRG
jgi:hypothetical protein